MTGDALCTGKPDCGCLAHEMVARERVEFDIEVCEERDGEWYSWTVRGSGQEETAELLERTRAEYPHKRFRLVRRTISEETIG